MPTGGNSGMSIGESDFVTLKNGEEHEVLRWSAGMGDEGAPGKKLVLEDDAGSIHYGIDPNDVASVEHEDGSVQLNPRFQR